MPATSLTETLSRAMNPASSAAISPRAEGADSLTWIRFTTGDQRADATASALTLSFSSRTVPSRNRVSPYMLTWTSVCPMARATELAASPREEAWGSSKSTTGSPKARASSTARRCSWSEEAFFKEDGAQLHHPDLLPVDEPGDGRG